MVVDVAEAAVATTEVAVVAEAMKMEKEAAAAAIKIKSPSPVQLFTMEHNKEKEMIGKSTTYFSFLSITHHDYHS